MEPNNKYYKTCTDASISPQQTPIFTLLTHPPTLHTCSSSKVYVSTGPVTGECPAEESDDRDLNIKQNIAHIINQKFVTYILYLLQILSLLYSPSSTPHPTTIIIHLHIHNHHYSESGPNASVNMTTSAAVSNHTYQVPNPIIHTPHPTTGVIYTDINPQKTKKGQKTVTEVVNLRRYTGVLLHMYIIAMQFSC